MKSNIAVGLLGVALAATSQAGMITVYDVGGPYAIQDNTGIATALNIPLGQSSIVTDVNVWLDLGPQATAGSMWNGDIVAYLTHGGAPAVNLLNRIGQDATHPDGFSNNGLQFWLDDAAGADVHTAGGSYDTSGPVAGTFSPDVGALTAFNGLGVSGDWVLQVYDDATGKFAQVNRWGLEINYRDVTQVPDSSLGGVGFSAILFGGLLALARRRSLA